MPYYPFHQQYHVGMRKKSSAHIIIVMSLAVNKGLKLVKLEGDSLLVTYGILQNKPSPDWAIVSILSDIQALLKKMTSRSTSKYVEVQTYVHTILLIGFCPTFSHEAFTWT